MTDEERLAEALAEYNSRPGGCTRDDQRWLLAMTRQFLLMSAMAHAHRLEIREAAFEEAAKLAEAEGDRVLKPHQDYDEARRIAAAIRALKGT